MMRKGKSKPVNFWSLIDHTADRFAFPIEEESREWARDKKSFLKWRAYESPAKVKA